MKKLICLFIIGMLLLPNLSFAAEKQIEYTLPDAQRIAVTNSRQAKLDDISIRAMEIQLKKIKDQGTTGGYPGDSMEGVLEYQKKIKIKPAQAELDLTKAKRTKAENLRKLNLEVFSQASDIYILNKEIEKENKKLINLKERLKILESKNKAGQITGDVVTNTQWDINSKENSLEDMSQKLNEEYLSFKKLLNIDLDKSKIIIKFTNEFKEYKIQNIYDYTLIAQNNSFEVYNKQQALKMEQDILELTDVYFNEGQYEYDNEKLNVEKANNELQDILKNIETNVMNKYNNLLSQKEKVNLAVEYLKLSDKKLSAAQLKYKNGVSNKEEFLSAQDNYLDAEYQKESAIVNYNILSAELADLESL